MNTAFHYRGLRIVGVLLLAVACANIGWARHQAPPQQQPPPTPPPSQQKDAQQPGKDSQSAKADKDVQAESYLPRGKKLYLKDGTFQLVRSYERQGESVRYYSVERSDWEEIPSNMVDWDSTAKAESAQAQEQKDFATKVREREAKQNAVEVLDVDASLLVGNSVILPDGQGMYVLSGKSITELKESKTELKIDKARVTEKILSGIPALIPTRHMLEVKGKHATARVPAGELEFYYRIAPEGDEPELALIRAKEKGDVRVVEWISTNVVGESDESRNNISLLKWEVAKGVYRFTLSQPVEPGEYALTIILPDTIADFVWDFGVDRGTVSTTAKPK